MYNIYHYIIRRRIHLNYPELLGAIEEYESAKCTNTEMEESVIKKSIKLDEFKKTLENKETLTKIARDTGEPISTVKMKLKAKAASSADSLKHQNEKMHDLYSQIISKRKKIYLLMSRLTDKGVRKYVNRIILGNK